MFISQLFPGSVILLSVKPNSVGNSAKTSSRNRKSTMSPSCWGAQVEEPLRPHQITCETLCQGNRSLLEPLDSLGAVLVAPWAGRLLHPGQSLSLTLSQFRKPFSRQPSTHHYASSPLHRPLRAWAVTPERRFPVGHGGWPPQSSLLCFLNHKEVNTPGMYYHCQTSPSGMD